MMLRSQYYINSYQIATRSNNFTSLYSKLSWKQFIPKYVVKHKEDKKTKKKIRHDMLLKKKRGNCPSPDSVSSHNATCTDVARTPVAAVQIVNRDTTTRRGIDKVAVAEIDADMRRTVFIRREEYEIAGHHLR